MFIRPCYRAKDGKRHAYWALVESVRTPLGPRQRVVAYLGQMDESGRLGVREAARKHPGHQRRLDDAVAPRWVTIDAHRVRVERCLELGGPWLGLELMRKVGLTEFLQRALPSGQEQVRWSMMATILVLCRLCQPSSELHIAEHYYRQTAMADLLGVPVDQVNDDRLYRALDQLLPHKEQLEIHLADSTLKRDNDGATATTAQTASQRAFDSPGSFADLKPPFLLQPVHPIGPIAPSGAK